MTHNGFHRHNCAAPISKVPEASANTRRGRDSVEPITVVDRWANVVLQVVGGDADVYRLGDLERFADFSRDPFIVLCSIPTLACGTSFHRRFDSSDGLALCGCSTPLLRLGP